MSLVKWKEVDASLNGSPDFSGSLKITGSFILYGGAEFTDGATGSFTGSFGGELYDTLNNTGTPGQIIKSTGSSFIWTDNIADAAQDLIISGRNMSGEVISKGTPLYFTGSNTQGNTVGVFPANAGDKNRMPAGGVAAQTLAAGEEGNVYIYGFINKVDTSNFNAGDNVYVAVGGGYTNIKPTGSALIQKLGNVEKVSVSNGSGVITGPSWYNDLPNWEEGKIKVGISDGQPVTSSFVHLDEAGSTFEVAGTVSATSLVETSNREFKTNITPLDHGLDVIMDLKPVGFNWKKDGSPSIGLIADEVGEVTPYLVESQQKGVLYSKVVVYLIKAIQEQQKQIDRLRERLNKNPEF